MGYNVYKGKRYVPKIMGAWDRLTAYESLSVVLWEGNSYTSKKDVPPGVEITNSSFWVVTGNYNGQIEVYRQEVKNYSKLVESKANKADLEDMASKLELVNTFHMNNTISKLKNNEPVTIVFLGDSTTEDNATTHGKPNHVALIREWLNSLYPGLVTVLNKGVSGNNIVQMGKRLYKDVLSHNPDLIIISSGINDQGGTNSITIESFRENYSRMLQEILSSRVCDVVLRTPNMVIDPSSNKKIDLYNDVTRDLSQKYNLGFYDLFNTMKADKESGKITVTVPDFMNDGVHPNEKGHLYIFNNFKKYFIPTNYIMYPSKNYKMINGTDGFSVLSTGATQTKNTSYMNGCIVSWNTRKPIETNFYGGGFYVVYTSAPSAGKFKVIIDGVDQPPVDTYRTTVENRLFQYYNAPFSKHKILIENMDSKNDSSTGYNMNIEGIIFDCGVVVNENVIPLYSYVALSQTNTIPLVPSVPSTFIYNSVLDNNNIIERNLASGLVTFKKSGLYSLSFTTRLETDKNSLIVLNYKKNDTEQKSVYFNSMSSEGRNLQTIDLNDIVQIDVGDNLLFSIMAGGTSPTVAKGSTSLKIVSIS